MTTADQGLDEVGGATDALIMAIQDVTTVFHREGGPVAVVDNVSLDLRRGEVLGIVGESGSGKSMLLRSMVRILPKAAETIGGRVTYEGRDLMSLSTSDLHSVRGGEIGMVFQDPTAALNPVYTVRRQIYAALGSHQKLSTAELERRAVQTLTDVGIPSAAQRLDEYPHQFSGGMAQRVVIAIALASDPKVLLADEPTTALDVTTQRQILLLLLEIQRRRRMTLIFVSHSLGVIAQLCDRVAVMYAGQLVELADTLTLFTAPKHPYTVGLLSCVPDAHKPRSAPLIPIPGTVPDPGEYAVGCRFAPRCPVALDACRAAPIELIQVANGHVARCIRTEVVALDAGLFSKADMRDV